jgi:hypothetical protein
MRKNRHPICIFLDYVSDASGCPRVDSNHHTITGTGPQPAAYTIPPRGQFVRATRSIIHQPAIFVNSFCPAFTVAYFYNGIWNFGWYYAKEEKSNSFTAVALSFSILLVNAMFPFLVPLPYTEGRFHEDLYCPSSVLARYDAVCFACCSV